ncbi:hypothetical protein PsorP6_007208 [Peronosclerospora sorghi]|uniref:Uncharacterized protein n=1 Tax=Peronosclerospora sorghi TaxID=230839 RepID=A0ACC0WD00_9STRA|nr:hypothetical protein PsorP6_007208 [Peronosclerospora sorghi]
MKKEIRLLKAQFDYVPTICFVFKFSDETMIRLIPSTKTVERSKKFAEKLEERFWLQKWFQKKRTTEEVFNLLKLKEMGYHIFGSPQLKSWGSYVMKVSQHMGNADEFLVISEL